MYWIYVNCVLLCENKIIFHVQVCKYILFIFCIDQLAGSPQKQESKSDVLPAKIQYHLDDPNVKARPIIVSEKRTKPKRSRSLSSDSSKSRSSRSSVSSRSRSRSLDNSDSETEEQRKEKEKKKFEVGVSLTINSILLKILCI